MEGPRAPTESELPSVLDFLNSELRPQSSWSIANEYPTTFSSLNQGNIRIFTDQGKVISHAVLKPLIVKTPLAILKVGAIGSVVTHEKYRGQGYSRKIISECNEEALRQGCDLTLLWTNLYDFYRKMDFELAGHEESFVLEKEFSVPDRGLKFLKGPQVAAEAIFRLYNSHSVASVRTIEDIRKYLAIPETNIYTAWDAHGQLKAFAAEGKGADLKGYVHEWGGQVSDLLALFSFIRREKKTPFTVILPAHSSNLLTSLAQLPVIHNEGFLGMIKIINSEALFLKVKKAARTLGIADLVLDQHDGFFRAGIGSDLIEFSDIKDLTRLIFGPFPEIPELKDQTRNQLQRVLPLPLWIWGWDSI